MNEKAITLTVFFISVFLLYQIRFIVRLRKLKKIRGDVTEKGFAHVAFLSLLECCCDPECWCRCTCNTIGLCLDGICGKLQEKNAIEQSDGVEQRTKESLAEIELERKIRIDLVERLRVNGYTASEKNRNKVLETVSINPETNLSWTSASTRIPVEEIIIIIEDEPDFEIKDEYIINKRKMIEKEETEKIETTERICLICANPYELGSAFCLNCGQKL